MVGFWLSTFPFDSFAKNFNYLLFSFFLHVLMLIRLFWFIIFVVFMFSDFS